MAQIPFMSLSALVHYFRNRLVFIKDALLFLTVSLLSSQTTAALLTDVATADWGRAHLYSNVTRADLILAVFYTLSILPLGIYSIYRSIKKDKAETEEGEVKNRTLITIAGGAVFGFISSLLGIGGGFLAVPFFLYVLRYPMREAVAGSLFMIFIITSITTIHYSAAGQVHYMIALIAATGTVSGAQIGSRFAVKQSGDKVKLAFGIFQVIIVFTYLILRLCP